MIAELLGGFGDGMGEVDGVALPGQADLQRAGQAVFVFDDQQSHPLLLRVIGVGVRRCWSFNGSEAADVPGPP